jgi:peptidoglycan-associated lipoprotein
MKLRIWPYTLLLSLILAVTATGCRKAPVNVADIPGYKKGIEGEVPKPEPFMSSTDLRNGPEASTTGIPVPDPTLREHWIRNREIFSKDTVYFDFDSSVVKSSEQPKVAKVAAYVKAHPGVAVEVEGHCDERGTEEYNRSLGERRALALRESLAHHGVDPKLIDTTSYGKDRPASPGHNDAAYKKNRRGEFLLETPPK